MKLKRTLAGVLTFAMALTLAACGEAPAGEPAAQPGTDGPQNADAVQTGQLTPWEESSQIFATDETEAELYEKAKAEGSVTVYSISSRITKVMEAFNKKYPGVKCESFAISTNELLEKVTREYDAGVHSADLIHIKDQDGSIWNEYIQQKKFYNFRPADILSHIDEKYTQYSTPLYIELTQLFYNSEKYPDGAPVDNLWDLTRPEWKGRFMMQNPLDNLSYSAWATGMCTGDTPAQLEQAYEEEFGEKLVLSEGCENAGYEWLKRIKANAPIIGASDDEMAEAVGARGQEDPPIAFFSSVKMRKAKDNDWAIAPANLKPTVGIPSFNTLYVVGECEHPYAAKLLQRFMMGGTDGDISGYEPFNTLGGWPVRDDIAAPEGTVPLEEISMSDFDPMAIYDNIIIFQDFWALLG